MVSPPSGDGSRMGLRGACVALGADLRHNARTPPDPERIPFPDHETGGPP